MVSWLWATRFYAVFITQFLPSSCQLRIYFTPCSSVSVVNFEHVTAGWACILGIFKSLFKDF